MLIEAVEALDLLVLLLVADGGVEDKAVVRLAVDAIAQIGADQGAFDLLAIAVGDIDVAVLQLGDRPAVVAADAALGLALGGDGGGHVRALGHVLDGERAAGKGPVVVQHHPAAFILVAIALLAQEAPDILDGAVRGALQQVGGNLGAAVGEALALPVAGVEHDLLARLLHLRDCGHSSQSRTAQQHGHKNFLHVIPPDCPRRRMRLGVFIVQKGRQTMPPLSIFRPASCAWCIRGRSAPPSRRRARWPPPWCRP
jgi:hypothetical protein